MTDTVATSYPGQLLFDFKKFLEGGALDDIFPGPTNRLAQNLETVENGWEVTKLSGGLINLVVRVTPRRSHHDHLVKNLRSVVIKYAPPYVAAISEDAPFGTFRQVIEYRALSLLGSTPTVRSAEDAHRVTVPRVLKFFEDERLLVLQDLGEWMKPLCSWLYPLNTVTQSPPSPETCSSVGTRLGNFLASIHCDAALLLESQMLTDNGVSWFENPDTKDLVRDQVVGRALPILQLRIDTGRAEKIARIISRDFESEKLLSTSPSSGLPRSMFSIGDLWTGSILVGAPPATSSGNPRLEAVTEVEMGLIDWEFASPARIGQDIAQLSAWLHLFSTSSTWSSAKPCRYPAVEEVVPNSPISSVTCVDLGSDIGDAKLGWRSVAGTLPDALLKAYALKVKDYPNYSWFVDEDYDQRRYKKERLAVIRSIWILFGREIIVDSVEAKDKFICFFTRDEDFQMWQKEMIEVGCWYVSMAGECSDEEFEEVVTRECILKRIYTVSGASETS